MEGREGGEEVMVVEEERKGEEGKRREELEGGMEGRDEVEMRREGW